MFYSMISSKLNWSPIESACGCVSMAREFSSHYPPTLPWETLTRLWIPCLKGPEACTYHLYPLDWELYSMVYLRRILEGHLTQTIIVVGLFSSVCLFRLFKARGNFYRFCIPQSGPQRLNLSCGVPASYRGTERSQHSWSLGSWKWLGARRAFVYVSYTYQCLLWQD